MSDEKKPMSWFQLLGFACGQEKPDEPIRLNKNYWDLEDVWGKELSKSFPISHFSRDYERIVSSSDFRALQDKTQVYPLSKSDIVRTRLTHSNEVSIIARQLALMCFQNNAKGNTKMKVAGKAVSNEAKTYVRAKKIKNDIEIVLSCAGLLHDIGNPPFGHKGEDYIRDWFRRHLVLEGSNALTYVLPDDGDKDERGAKRIHNVAEEMGLKQNENGIEKPEMILDLENFEGNAQAIRILCKARYQSGVDVSDAVISTIIKYPTTSVKYQETRDAIDKEIESRMETDERITKLNRDDPEYENEWNKIIQTIKAEVEDDIRINPLIRHKNGYYHSEKKCVEKIATELGLTNGHKDENGDLVIWRHPLAYLLEAADDIAYLTADIEDAVNVELISIEELYNFMCQCLHEERQKPSYRRDVLNYARKALNQLGRMIGKDELSEKDIKEWNLHEHESKAAYKSKAYSAKEVSHWGTYLRTWMMYIACNRFNADYGATDSDKEATKSSADQNADKDAGWIMEGNSNGSFNYELLKAPNSYARITCHMLREVMKEPVGTKEESVYNSPMIVAGNNAGKETITFLLDKFIPAAINNVMGAETSPTDRMLFELIPKSLKEDFEKEITIIRKDKEAEYLHIIPEGSYDAMSAKEQSERDLELEEALRNLFVEDKDALEMYIEEQLLAERLYHCILMVVDYVSSMTDNSARNLYSLLLGKV